MSDNFLLRLRDTVRTVPDFPIEGIMFRDITPVLADGTLLSDVVDQWSRSRFPKMETYPYCGT